MPLIILGVIGTFFYHVLFFSALQYTTAINSSLIGATNPVLTTLIAALFFNEKLTQRRILGTWNYIFIYRRFAHCNEC